ncbi:MAG: hypothetical protein HWN68_16395 [Desulfobacterales bacterium]|nr:hypothetical protein [Desulfobacterales bacterium]
MKWNLSNRRVWLFRGLVAIAAILILVSFIMPWWICTISEVPAKDPIRIYGYGLRHSLVELRSYIEADETPFYQTVLAWVYLAASVGFLLYSTWLKGGKGRWLLGGIGLIYVAYATIAVTWIAIRTGDFGISLLGWSSRTYTFVVVSHFASLQVGYYLAHGAGLTCIALALLRNKITGKPKPGT